MSRLEVPIGTRFGRLVVVGEGGTRVQPSGQIKRLMACQCDCGSRLLVNLNSLRRGLTQSCGCFKLERTKKANSTHGMSAALNYGLWCNIKSRTVTGTSAKEYYKGRGITMHEPWVSDFQAFENWLRDNLGERPKGCSLDRINNAGNYEPGNLRWATREIQNNNTRRNVSLTYGGETLTVSQWGKRLKMDPGTLRSRVSILNWPAEKALTTPVRKSNRAHT